MSKGEIGSYPARPGASEAVSAHGRVPALVDIGFVGLGHMGAAMAANLAAAGHRVTAYVRRLDQMDKLAALGLEPTTESPAYSTADRHQHAAGRQRRL
jgi:3-hydroxyacyl-CoA dehydrogenase